LNNVDVSYVKENSALRNNLDNVDVNCVKENSAIISRNHIGKTKNLMSLKKEDDSFVGKTPNDLEFLRQKALDLTHSEETQLKKIDVNRNHINIYEKFSSEGFYLIATFVSARRAGKFLDINGSSITKYMNSGEIYKYRYKFSSK
jgi:hypothetical protein